jgi:hypothetical protein
MAFQIDNCAATPEGVVVWLSWESGDDPNALSTRDFTVRLGTRKGDPEAELSKWLGGWDNRGHFELVPGPQATDGPNVGTDLAIEIDKSSCSTRVLPAGALDVFHRRPDAGDFLQRAERIAGSAENIAQHADTATTDTGRIADSAERVAGETDRLVAYPMLTSDGASPGSGAGALSAAGERALLDKHVKALVPNVPRELDADRLEAAIVRATEPVEINGTTKYLPRKNPYGAADIAVAQGGLAGAQASSVIFAGAQLEASLPLLESVESLDVTSDQQVIDADRAILRSSWLAFVGELSREGGPRAQRANALANNLDGLSSLPGGINPLTNIDPRTGLAEPINYVDRLGFELGMLTIDQFGNVVPNRTNLNVVTLDEEKALSDYLTLRDLIQATTAYWRNRQGDIFQPVTLGTGLVRLQRLFAVLDESVDEAQAAFDSVFFDDDQRGSQPIGTADDAMTIQDLFEWLSTFATEEGPALVNDGGSRGMLAINDAAATLLQTVADFQAYIDAPAPAANAPRPAPEVLRHPRVTNALGEIAADLRNIVQTTTPTP